jgi:hypothetical protein
VTVAVYFLYEWLLFNGWKDWILGDSRDHTNFVDANREGLTSIIMFVMIVLAGITFRDLLIAKHVSIMKDSKGNKKIKIGKNSKRNRFIKVFAAYLFIISLLYFIFRHILGQEPS